ncbi:MAG: ATP-dependent zinc metalloprotease FtsH [Gammaproteobacteria bacterium]
MPQPQPQKSPQHTLPPRGNWSLVMWLVIGLLLAFYWQNAHQTQELQTISYTQFKQDVSAGRVKQVTFMGDRITGVLEPGKANANKSAKGTKASKAAHFTTVKPAITDPGLLPLLEKHRVTIRAKAAGRSWWVTVVVGLLPWLLLIGLFYWGMRRMQQAGPQGRLFGFGKSRAKRFEKSSSSVTFDDVAGLDNAKTDMREIIGYLREPERFRKLGAKIPKGVLLAGPPGTGKTLLAKAVAGEADAPFFSISASEFIEMFVGVGASRVRDMFESAKREAPAIIFIDELDAVGRARGTGIGGGHDEREQTLNQILSEMDGFTPSEAVVVMAATNRPDVLDPALMRPGRFDRKVTLELPERPARKQILQVHTRHVPLDDDVDLDTMAARTVGFSGADLENLVNEAALLAARERREKVSMQTMSTARDKILMGAERDTLLSEDEKRLIAFHEAGHAMLAWLLPHADPLDKVTIIPRGRALGVTEQTPDEDRHNLKESYLRDRIAVMLGGRVSEQMVFGEVTSGAEQDLKQATALARRMIGQWGMSDKLGPVAFRRGEQHIFLGQEMAQERDYSEHTAQIIDDEIRTLLEEIEAMARQLLQNNRQKLETVVDALLERETLEAHQLRELLREPPAGAVAQG